MLKKLLAFTCLTLSIGANAASVSLVGQAPPNPVNVGDIVSFDVVLDFSDRTTIGGGFDVIFDQSQLAFNAVVSAGLGDPTFYRVPDVLPGRLSGWAVGDFNGISAGTVGSVSFQVLAGATSSVVALGDTNSVAGPFVDFNTFQLIFPDYNAVDVIVEPAVVPIPAAAWLFGSALLGLGALKRRKA